MGFDFIKWIKKPQVLDASNRCMKVMEEIGISQNDALDVLVCLKDLVERSNYLSSNEYPFKSKRVEIVCDDGSYSFTDLD